MSNRATPSTFQLSTLYPGWSGVRITNMERPLRLGMALLQTQLDAADWAALITRREFDYDGVLDEIELISPMSATTDKVSETQKLLAQYQADILATNPRLKLDPQPVLPMEVLPATRSRMPGVYPAQHVAVRLANDALYEAVYLRVHVIEPSDTDLFDAVLGLDGIQDALVSYIHELGRAAAG